MQHLLKDGERGRRRVRLLARDRASSSCSVQGGRPRDRRRRQGVADHLELVGVHRRRHRDGARRRRRADGHGVHAVPSDRHGVAAVSVRGILVTEGVRGDGGMLQEQHGRALHVQLHPRALRAETADTDEEADALVRATRTTRRTPELLPRDEVARAINAEVKAGRGSPHGGVFLDIASRRPADYIKRKLPSMYHQFKELADVDITKEPMEVGPTLHYIMGGIRVDADTAADDGAGPVRARARSRRACTARTASAATRSPTCSCSAGSPARPRPSTRKKATRPPKVDDGADRRAFAQRDADAVRARPATEPVHAPRGAAGRRCRSSSASSATRTSSRQALARARGASRRAPRHAATGQSRSYNPGWHEALDLENLLVVSEAVTRAALMREESRGAHTRDDFPDDRRGVGQVQRRHPKRDGGMEVDARSRSRRCRPSSARSWARTKT